MEKPSMQELIATLPQTGTIEWIGVRPGKREAMVSLPAVEITTEDGLAGDHYQGKSKMRQVTLIQAEHLQGVVAMLKKDAIDPGLVRRNIVVAGVNLLAFKDRTFQIGEVVLEFTGLCHPCSRMEENLGPGGYNAMRGHGGIMAKVISGGRIRVGDDCRIWEVGGEEGEGGEMGDRL